MNQTQKILDYIDKFGSISPLEAIRDLGIMRLAARIADLEHQGVKIERETEMTFNRFGEKTHYARYKRATA